MQVFNIQFFVMNIDPIMYKVNRFLLLMRHFENIPECLSILKS